MYRYIFQRRGRLGAKKSVSTKEDSRYSEGEGGQVPTGEQEGVLMREKDSTNLNAKVGQAPAGSGTSQATNRHNCSHRIYFEPTLGAIKSGPFHNHLVELKFNGCTVFLHQLCDYTSFMSWNCISDKSKEELIHQLAILLFIS